MMILIVLNVFMFATFGLLIASISKTTRTTTFLLAIFMGTMILFGDVLISIPKDSIWYKWSYALPIKYSIDSLRKVALLNYNLSMVSKDLYIMLLFTITSFVVSYVSLSYIEKNKIISYYKSGPFCQNGPLFYFIIFNSFPIFSNFSTAKSKSSFVCAALIITLILANPLGTVGYPID